MAEVSPTIKAWMKKANASWQEDSKKAKEGTNTLPDGRYIAQHIESKLIENTKGDPMIVSKYKVLEGDYAGETATEFRSFGTEDAFFWFGKSVLAMGYDPEDIHWDASKPKDDGYILNYLDTLSTEQAAVNLQVSTKNGYTNIRVNNVIDDYELPEAPAPAKAAKAEAPAKAKTKAAPTSEPDEDEEEEEEAPAPAKGRGRPPGAKNKPKEPEIEPDEEEEEAEEEEAEEEEDEEAELAVGMKVGFTWKGEAMEGTVKEILDDGTETVKVKVGTKIYPVKFDKLTLVDGDTD